MHRLLIRAALVSLGIALVLFLIPSAIAGFVILTAEAQQTDRGDHWMFTPFAFIVGVIITAVATVVIAVWWVRRYARRAVEPLRTLADQAERLGAGDARFAPLESGIEEVDRVSEILGESARHLVTSLSSERDFASDASHQLRTPLTAILMRLEEISATDDLDLAHDEAAIAIDLVERLNGTVDELMARARSRSNAAPKAVSLDTVLAGLQREWQPSFADQSRSIRVTGERGLRVATTLVALSQILSTLVENSLAHGGGTMTIDARRSGPSVVVEASDEGPGIAATIAPHVFERSVSTSSTGLGLGLARDLAEAHGGRLELVQAQPVLFALFLSEADESSLA